LSGTVVCGVADFFYIAYGFVKVKYCLKIKDRGISFDNKEKLIIYT